MRGVYTGWFWVNERLPAPNTGGLYKTRRQKGFAEAVPFRVFRDGTARFMSELSHFESRFRVANLRVNAHDTLFAQRNRGYSKGLREAARCFGFHKH